MSRVRLAYYQSLTGKEVEAQYNAIANEPKYNIKATNIFPVGEKYDVFVYYEDVTMKPRPIE